MKKLIFKHRSHSSEKVILFVQFRAVLSLRCGAGSSLAAASRLFPSCSAQSNPWLLVAEHVVRGLQEVLLMTSVCGSRAPELRLSVAVNGLSCSKASGIFPDQGSNLCLLHCSGDSYH